MMEALWHQGPLLYEMLSTFESVSEYMINAKY